MQRFRLLSQTNHAAPEWRGSYELYQNREFADIAGRHYHLKVFDQGGMLVLFRHLPILGAMRGVLGSPEVVGEYRFWWEKLQGLRWSYLHVHTTQNVPAFESFRVSPVDNYSMVVDLSPGEEGVLKSFQRDNRQTVLAGKRRGIRVEEGRNESDLNRFYEIVGKVSKGGTLFELPPYHYVRDLFNSPFATLLLARAGEATVGGVFFLLNRKIMHAWIGGIDREFTHLKPGNAMYFESMKWGISHGYGLFDFWDQSLSKNPELTQFKMSFNPLLAPAYTYVVPGSRLKALLSDAKDRLSSLWRQDSPKRRH